MVYQTTNMINDKIYDGYLITLGDYSVQGKISQGHWDRFLDGQKSKGISEEFAVVHFEKILGEQIEEWLMRNDKNQSAEYSMYAVADIQLAFDNNEIMKMLTDRANALKAGKFEKAKEIQEKMTQYKNDNFEALT